MKKTIDGPSAVREMFGSISPRYDLLNHLLSFGIDVHWRKAVAGELAGMGPGGTFLDVATGTGDLAFEMVRSLGEKCRVVGVDFSEPMLRIGQRKWTRIRGRWDAGPRSGGGNGSHGGRCSPVGFHCGDALNLPFPDRTFDGAACAFGVRNFGDLHRGLAEILRVLKPGGKLAVLEFSTPINGAFRFLYRTYSHYVLPVVGRLVSRHPTAYTYLPESVARFPVGEQFRRELERAGFFNAGFRYLSGGIVSIHTGLRPAEGGDIR